VSGIQTYYQPLNTTAFGAIGTPLNQMPMGLISGQPYGGGSNPTLFSYPPTGGFNNYGSFGGGYGGGFGGGFGCPPMMNCMPPQMNCMPPQMNYYPPFYQPVQPNTNTSTGFEYNENEDEFSSGWNQSYSLSQYSTVIGNASRGDSKTSQADLEDYKNYIIEKANKGQLAANDAKNIIKILNHALDNFDLLSESGNITRQTLKTRAERDGNGADISADDMDPNFIPKTSASSSGSNVFKLDEIADLLGLDLHDDADKQVEFSRNDLKNIAIDLESELGILQEDTGFDPADVQDIQRKLAIIEFLMDQKNFDVIAQADELGTVYDSTGAMAKSDKITLGEIIQVSTASTKEADRFGLTKGDVTAFKADLRDTRFEVPERPENKFHIDFITEFEKFQVGTGINIDHGFDPDKAIESLEKLRQKVGEKLLNAKNQDEYDKYYQYNYFIDFLEDHIDGILKRLGDLTIANWNNDHPNNEITDPTQGSDWRQNWWSLGWGVMGLGNNNYYLGDGSGWEAGVYPPSSQQGDDLLYLSDKDFP